LTGFFWAWHELPEQRPGCWSMRFMLIHDTVHAGRRPRGPDSYASAAAFAADRPISAAPVMRRPQEVQITSHWAAQGAAGLLVNGEIVGRLCSPHGPAPSPEGHRITAPERSGHPTAGMDCSHGRLSAAQVTVTVTSGTLVVGVDDADSSR
jgi:hypothetical protein